MTDKRDMTESEANKDGKGIHSDEVGHVDILKLTQWLGVEGALSGLEKSNLTNAELMLIARESGITVDKKTARKQIVVELVMSDQRRIEKSQDYLLRMSAEELQRYFSDRLVSAREIMNLLKELGIAPKGKVRGKLADYAAREIGELGRFQRVAKGTSGSRLD